MSQQTRISLTWWMFGSAVSLVAAAGIAIGAAMYWQLSSSMGGDVEAILSRDLERAVVKAAAGINGDTLAEVVRNKDAKSASYKEMQSVLHAVQREFNLKTDLYTLHRDGERTQFGLTAKPDPLVGLGYDLKDEMRPIFDGSKVVARTGVYEDAHGAWVSAYAAIRDSQGAVVGLVEADHDLVPYVKATQQRLLHAFWLALLLAFGLAGPLAFFGSRALVRPLKELSEVAEKVSQGDVDNVEVNRKAIGEIGHLAESFDRAIVAARYFISRIDQLENGDGEDEDLGGKPEEGADA